MIGLLLRCISGLGMSIVSGFSRSPLPPHSNIILGLLEIIAYC